MSQSPRFSQRAQWSSGSPISDLMARALAAPQLISLAAGFVDQQTLPVIATRDAIDEILQDETQAKAALQYGTTHGYPPLRDAVRMRHLAADGGTASQPAIELDQVVLTAGSNQLLHLVAESLIDPGDIVLCASPTYFVYLGTLRNMGARTVGVATDDEGLVPSALEAELQRLERAGELGKVKAIYVVSYFDNPRGLTLSAQRRAQVVQLAKKYSTHGKIYVLEDAAYRDLRYAGPDEPSMRTFDDDGQSVIVAGTFSKSFSPGIRVGWGILPRDLVGPVCDQKGNLDFGSPNFAQHLVFKVFEKNLLESHIAEIRAGYIVKMQAMLAACDEHLDAIPSVAWQIPCGGLYVWLKLPTHVTAGTSGKLFDLALAEGMLYVPGEYCYPVEGEAVAKNTIRLSFGVQSPSRIAQGIEKLARAIVKLNSSA